MRNEKTSHRRPKFRHCKGLLVTAYFSLAHHFASRFHIARESNHACANSILRHYEHRRRLIGARRRTFAHSETTFIKRWETMETTTEIKYQTTVAARVAGEDIQQGDYVTVLNEIVELPSFLWCCSGGTLPTDEPVRIRYMPSGAGQPFKVVAVCLPFVYTKRPKGGTTTFDTRQHQLVRLDPDSGGAVWKRLRKTLKKKRK